MNVLCECIKECQGSIGCQKFSETALGYLYRDTNRQFIFGKTINQQSRRDNLELFLSRRAKKLQLIDSITFQKLMELHADNKSKC